MKALVVDDEFTSRKILQRLLLSYGECDIAANGPEAIEAFGLAHQEGCPYDLICLDIMMPEMSGHETLRMIRDMEVIRGISEAYQVKVIMISASSDRKDVISAARNKCEGYLIKPVDPLKLLERMESLGLLALNVPIE